MILLSILIPSIPERLPILHALINRYQDYIEKYNLTEWVEIVSIIDNKKRSIGQKRSDLIALAQGKYFVITDDDDELLGSYFRFIHEAIDQDKDVITYKQWAVINDDSSTVVFRLKSENDELQKDGITRRKAWHCCTWKIDIVKDIEWSKINWGEDSFWADFANLKAETEYHIDEICHIYRHDSTKTAAFQ
jgi:glycosyltransferase involved in cell wall biosynthesis